MAGWSETPEVSLLSQELSTELGLASQQSRRGLPAAEYYAFGILGSSSAAPDFRRVKSLLYWYLEILMRKNKEEKKGKNTCKAIIQ